ncbi:hypothetical protein [Sporosarcina sp. NCCP-2222]|uniref:hypothetical protein n=1 Tax=Sporosarcina sp. NCCP-2222 TaxID=2935073 RepID=UPI0020BF67B5|nr:hypothetical protein [Sporosarcina sp. NCCP-2222]
MNPDIFIYIVITSISGVLSLFLAIYVFSDLCAFETQGFLEQHHLHLDVPLLGHLYIRACAGIDEQ